MSIETLLKENTEALKALTIALAANHKTGAAAVAAAPAKPTEKGKDTPPADEKALTYDDVKTPFLELVKVKGREAGVAVLKEFGAEKLPDVKPEKFKDVLAAIKKAATATAESPLA